MKLGKTMFKTVIFFSLFVFSLQLNAGKLGDFEKDIIKSKQSKSKKQKSRNQCHSCSSTDNHHNESFFDILFADIFDGIIEGTAVVIAEGTDISNQRIGENPADSGISHRKAGEILTPFYRFNINTQHVNDDINALDLKMEFGHGPLGFELRSTKYQDDLTNDELKYNQFQYFHRMSFGNKIGVNFGIGYAKMKIIESYDGLVLSLPVIFQNGRHLGFEVRPSVFDADGVSVTELDYSVLYTYRKMAFRVGHRSLESENIDIDGVYIGLDFIF